MIRALYEGEDRKALAFRGALFVFDLATIAYFLLTATATIDSTILAVDLAISVFVAADLIARFSISDHRWKFFLSVTTLADIVVIATLLVPLFAGSNLAFLRALRILRLLRGFHLMRQLDNVFQVISVNTRVSVAAANLLVFIFVVTSMVWVLEHDKNPGVETYVDALYFTITTLTTTGYGDITLTDRAGRILTIFIMLFGIGFFLKLIQALYRPDKVEIECSECGLKLHDPDASHCKHCGTVINIPTEGET
ncbi:ion channel [Palleronia abyssalis]|uniref:Voltage-gated potassium channel Kch n=1 Tax=Palleronia abyssalis TaxID=1501240 RepID=A0A2R8BUA3_9RHOB|nr:ion channel [Palleronia abyssalis]SPJ23732.1 Voltage-gated potassium channel Kch [Palleronia abyssalis]